MKAARLLVRAETPRKDDDILCDEVTELVIRTGFVSFSFVICSTKLLHVGRVYCYKGFSLRDLLVLLFYGGGGMRVGRASVYLVIDVSIIVDPNVSRP